MVPPIDSLRLPAHARRRRPTPPPLRTSTTDFSAEVCLKTCPLCMGQIPDAAVKCQHCGEWVDGRPPAAPTDQIGDAANRWVSNSTALGWAGFALAACVIVFVALPLSCEM